MSLKPHSIYIFTELKNTKKLDEILTHTTINIIITLTNFFKFGVAGSDSQNQLDFRFHPLFSPRSLSSFSKYFISFSAKLFNKLST